MYKLMKLEWRKHDIGKYIRNAVILGAKLCIFIFALEFLGIANDPETGVPDVVPGNDGISSPIELFTGMSFLVFTGIMMSSFIVASLRDKTMQLMFSYPIKRQKIVLAQILAVWIFNFIAYFCVKLLIYVCIFLSAKYLEPAFYLDFQLSEISFYIHQLIKTFVTVNMGIIALFVGMVLQSTKAVVVASFLLILLTQANVGDITLAGNGIFLLVLTVISFFCVFYILWRVEKQDLMERVR